MQRLESADDNVGLYDEETNEIADTPAEKFVTAPLEESYDVTTEESIETPEKSDEVAQVKRKEKGWCHINDCQYQMCCIVDDEEDDVEDDEEDDA